MLRTLVVASLASLPTLGAAAIAPARAGAAPAAIRTVVVVPQGARHAPRWVGLRDCIAYPRRCVNGTGGIEVAYLVRGKLPARARLGTVLTDTSCQPDAYGVSHCTNRIRLAGGRVVTVRHDHSMMNDPCLAPGERVRVRTA